MSSFVVIIKYEEPYLVEMSMNIFLYINIGPPSLRLQLTVNTLSHPMFDWRKSTFMCSSHVFLQTSYSK